MRIHRLPIPSTTHVKWPGQFGFVFNLDPYRNPYKSVFAH